VPLHASASGISGRTAANSSRYGRNGCPRWFERRACEGGETRICSHASCSIDVFGTTLKSTALISFVTAAAFLFVALTSPLLSGIADFVGNKKNFMKFFCYLGALSCISLYWFSLENIYWSLLAYFLGLVGFWGSLVFYNSYLPDIAFP
jgi:UMF1 family MFS transporter